MSFNRKRRFSDGMFKEKPTKKRAKPTQAIWDSADVPDENGDLVRCYLLIFSSFTTSVLCTELQSCSRSFGPRYLLCDIGFLSLRGVPDVVHLFGASACAD